MKRVLWIAVAAGVLLTMGWQQAGKSGPSPNATQPGHASTTSIRNAGVSHHAAMDDAQFVMTSFRATHATPGGYIIHNWSSVNGKFESISNLSTLADKIQQELSIQKAKKFTHKTDGENFLEIGGEWTRSTSVTVTLSSFRNPTGSDTTVLVIRVESHTGDLSNFENHYQIVSNTVKGLKLTPQISACVTGFTSARMGGGQKESLISEAFDAVQAHRIEGLQSNLVTSISGYSSLSSNELVTDGQRMNLQVATHYDAYHHRTNVLVGTPIITETY